MAKADWKKVEEPPPIPPTLLQHAAAEIDAELYDFMREVVSELDYHRYAMDFTAEEYRMAARAALYELWGFRRAGIDQSGADYQKQLDLLDSHLDWFHRQPAYGRLKQELADAFNRLSQPQTYIDHTTSVRDQTRQYWAYRRLALHATDPKVRELAGRSLKETHVPTVKVKQVDKRVVHLDMATARLIAETQAMVERRYAAGTSSPHGVHPQRDGNLEERGRREPLLLQSGRPPAPPAD